MLVISLELYIRVWEFKLSQKQLPTFLNAMIVTTMLIAKEVSLINFYLTFLF